MQVAKNSGLTLKLELTDILDHDLDDYTLIELADTRGSRRYRNEQRVKRAVTLSGIRQSPAALYRVRVAPQHYRPRQFFVSLKEGETASRRIAFPVEPGKVAGIQAPPHSRLAPALQRLLPETVYASLAPLQKACLLNVAAKAAATILGGGARVPRSLDSDSQRPARPPANPHQRGVGRGSRLVAAVRKRRRGLARRPRRLPAHPELQDQRPARQSAAHLFPAPEAGEDYLVDADIDEAQGLEHLFEVMRNAVRGPTNPYDVREILIAGQRIDPGYRFHVHLASRVTAAADPPPRAVWLRSSPPVPARVPPSSASCARRCPGS